MAGPTDWVAEKIQLSRFGTGFFPVQPLCEAKSRIFWALRNVAQGLRVSTLPRSAVAIRHNLRTGNLNDLSVFRRTGNTDFEKIVGM